MSRDPFDRDFVFSHHHATPQKLSDYEVLREASMLGCAAATLERRLK